MRTRALVPGLLAALVAGACTMPPKGQDGAAARPGEDAFFTAAFAAPADAAAGDEAPAARGAFGIEIVFQRSDGGRLAVPRVVALPGQPRVVLASAAGPGAPDDGARVECCARDAGGGAVSLAFRVRLSRAGRPTAGSSESVLVEGARRIDVGAQGLLARVSSPDGSGPMLVFARVTHAAAPEGPAPAASGDPLARPLTGATRLLRVSAVHVGRDLAPGTVVDETAAPDILTAAGGKILRDFRVRTCLDGRVRIVDQVTGPLAEAPLVSALRVGGEDDGTLLLGWTGPGGGGTASVRPATGRRFVALARLEGGGTAGVIVALDTED